MSRPLPESSSPIEAASWVMTHKHDEAHSACPLHSGGSTSSLRIYQDASWIRYECLCGCSESDIHKRMRLHQNTPQ